MTKQIDFYINFFSTNCQTSVLWKKNNQNKQKKNFFFYIRRRKKKTDKIKNNKQQQLLFHTTTTPHLVHFISKYYLLIHNHFHNHSINHFYNNNNLFFKNRKEMKISYSIALILGSLAILSSAKKPAIPRHMSLLMGDWDLTVYKSPLSPKTVFDDDFTAATLIHVSLKQRNDTKILDGFYLSEDFDQKEFIQVNFLDDLTGEVLLSKPSAKTLTDEEEEEIAAAADNDEFEGGEAPARPKAIRTAEMAEFFSLLKFSLSNESAGHYITQGAFGDNGSYQAVFTDKVKAAFTATVFEEGKDYYVTVLAKKADVPEPSFFQKYSTFIMMGIFLVTNLFKKNPTPAAPQNEAAAENNNNGEAAAPATTQNEAAATTTTTAAAAAPKKNAATSKKGGNNNGKKKAKKN